MQTIQTSWQVFSQQFALDILPLYQAHEQAFDTMGLHSRRHISRCVIFAELMARCYYKQGYTTLGFEGLRTAVAFHDSGRQGNGTDEWEAESGQLCAKYLIQQGVHQTYALSMARAIVEKNTQHDSLLTQILYDADVLDIMRLFVGNKQGIGNFRKKEWLFLSPQDLNYDQVRHLTPQRDKLIKEAWDFIFETEWMPEQPTRNEDFLPAYLARFSQNKQKFPLMNRFFNL